MAADDPASNNPFIRFKNRVDSHVRRGVDSIFGPPLETTSAKEQKTTPSARTEQQPRAPTNKPLEERRITTAPSTSDTMASYTPPTRRQNTTTSSAPDSDEERHLASVEDVHMWATTSPYSPLNLGHLPQPVPRDAPYFLNDSFTFQDAFEDLLLASKGRSLPGARERLSDRAGYDQLSQGFHHQLVAAGPWTVRRWVEYLGRRGLWDAYFPLSHRASTQLQYGALGKSWSRSEVLGTVQQSPKENDGRQGDKEGEEEDSLWSILAGNYRPTRSSGGDETERRGFYEGKQATPRADGPDTEESLAKTWSSMFAAPTTTAPAKPTTTTAGSSEVSSSEKDDETSETVDHLDDGGKVVTSVRKKSGRGRDRIITVTRQYDADGNLVARSRQTSSSTAWSVGGDEDAGASLSGGWRSVVTRYSSDDHHREDDRNVEEEAGKKRDMSFTGTLSGRWGGGWRHHQKDSDDAGEEEEKAKRDERWRRSWSGYDGYADGKERSDKKDKRWDTWFWSSK